MKAKWFGKAQLNAWDRNAPLPTSDDRTVRLGDRQDDGARGLWPVLAEAGARWREPFFTSGWIDAPVQTGKSPGAFAHPTVPSAHPYLMLNYLGKARDVMTLAHELGHGVHQVLAGPQGSHPQQHAADAGRDGERIRRNADLPLAARQDHRQEAPLRHAVRRKVEDMLNTVVRQIAFYTFERRVHTARKQGELTTEQLNEIWLDVSREAWARRSSSTRDTASSGPTSRTSSIRRSTSMRMPSGTAL